MLNPMLNLPDNTYNGLETFSKTIQTARLAFWRRSFKIQCDFGKLHTRFRYGSSFLRCNGIRPRPYIQLHLETPRWSLPMIRISPYTSWQLPMSSRALLRMLRSRITRPPRTISHLIILNIWRLSLCHIGGNVARTSLRWQCHVSCVLNPSRLSVSLSRSVAVTDEHVDNLRAQTLFAMRYSAASRPADQCTACNVASNGEQNIDMAVGVSLL